MQGKWTMNDDESSKQMWIKIDLNLTFLAKGTGVVTLHLALK